MRTHAERWSGVQRISLPRIGCGLDQLSWSLIEDVFKGIHVAITVYVAPQQNSTLNCEIDVEDVGSGREECPSWTPSGSEYIDEWIDRSEQSEWRHLDERGGESEDSRTARTQDIAQSSAERVSLVTEHLTNVRRRGFMDQL